MPPRYPEDIFISLLRSTYYSTQHAVPTRIVTSPSASRRLSSLAARGTTSNSLIGNRIIHNRVAKLPKAQKQTFATSGARNAKAREIAVIGGGITGLTTAHYLARHARDANITLYEGSERLGGWVDGKWERVGPGEHDKVFFQRGPRMLRSGRMSHKYDDLIFYELVVNLNLQDQIIFQDSPNDDRYLYYPDHLVRLPPNKKLTLDIILYSIRSFFTEPLWSGSLKSLRKYFGFRMEMLQGQDIPKNRPPPDESVGAYFRRVFGDDRLVKNVISGMMHGIYGGDIEKLSVKHTIFENTWRRTILDRPNIRNSIWVEIKDSILAHDMKMHPDFPKIFELGWKGLKVETIAFENGLLPLVKGLAKDLKDKKVTIKTNSPVTSLAYKNKKVLVTTTGKPKEYDQVICTLFSKHLSEIVQPKGSLPSLAKTQAVTIMVVNLWFPNPNLLDGNHGFGYLIPTSTPNNDECVLGVLFDSDMNTSTEIAGTKLTVMLGGHYWDGWTKLPTEEICKAMAIEAVQRHLHIPPDEPVHASARLCRDCLPQHHIGHRTRMADAHYELLSTFHGHLSVAGPSYTSIGVIPAMRAGHDIAMRVAYNHGPPYRYHPNPDVEHILPNHPIHHKIPDHVGATGLATFTENEFDSFRAFHRPSMFLRAWTGKRWKYGGHGARRA
ncbi:Protoporphyrinogen oxidase [Hypoxylon trugodes]|uniref:Protoporphyrinogen oxidase n=1 Tax=Hypoxylon trugodes TaxID=326681 RepID=UPI0021A0F17D|nr:Protoporphyrinogen oxidase [Hypoxylon trugodes]KAI1394226.1 Protoporphyrinogen oxidase [Hypoxylon trugodes]